MQATARAERSRRLDLDALRARCSVPDLLDALGHGTKRRWRRMPCPIHQGRNPTAFTISPDGQRWRCHSHCLASGDVFELAQRLTSCTFVDAVKLVARFGGFDPERLPQLGDAEAERAKCLRRRRRALRIWRNGRLRDLTAALYELDRDASWLHQVAVAARARDDAAVLEHWLDLMADVYVALESAEWLSSLLERADEDLWAALWLVEHRMEVS